MDIEDKNLKKLRKLLAVVDEDTLTRREFVDSFEQVVKLITKMRSENAENLEKTLDKMTETHSLMVSKLKEGNAGDFSDLKEKAMSLFKSQMAEILKAHAEHQKNVDDKLEVFADDLSEQKSAVETLTEKLESTHIPTVDEIEKDLPKLGEAIRDGLELLPEGQKLKHTAIEGLDAALKEKVKEVRVSGGGGRGIQLHVDGSRKGLTAQAINLIAGTGVTLTYSHAHGRNDITISASGGSLSLLTATGTIDDTNTAFTFESKPQLVIVNGASYREDKGWTWTEGTLTVTLDNPVGVGGDIYALG
jgi:hypothetical protein